MALTDAPHCAPRAGGGTACTVIARYHPAPDFHGTDTFAFTAGDGLARSGDATATIAVTPVDDPPVADRLAATTAEDVPVGIHLSGSDTEGAALGFAVVDPPRHGTLSGTAPDLTYTPRADFNGRDQFTYKATAGTAESQPATGVISVTPVNDGPTARPDAFTLRRGAGGGGSSLVLYVTQRFNRGVSKVTIADGVTTVDNAFVTGLPPTGPDGILFDRGGDLLISNTDAGTISRIDPATGRVIDPQINRTLLPWVADMALDPSGTALWVIRWNLGGPDAISRISLADGTHEALNPDGVPALGGITFDGTGERLFVSSHAGSVYEISPTDGHVVRSVTATGGPDGMTFDPFTGHVFTSSCRGLCEIDIGDGTQPLRFVGVRTATDGDGIAADGTGRIYVVPRDGVNLLDLRTNTVTSVVKGIPSADDVAPVIGLGAPPGGDARLVVPERDLVANDAAGPPDESGQKLTVTDVAATDETHGSVTLADRTITYAPERGFTGVARFTYTVCDDGTTAGAADPKCETGTVTVTVAANRRPVAENATLETAEDTALPLELRASDPDGDPLTYTVERAPIHGTLTGAAPRLRFEATPDFNGNDAFTFTAHDGDTDSAPATVTLRVTEVNDPPIAGDDAATAQSGLPATIPFAALLANDRTGPPNEAAQTLRVTAVEPTAETHGTVALGENGVKYTSEPAYSGPAGFRYTLCDDGTTAGAADGRCVTGAMSVTVNAGPQPTIVDDVASTTVDTPVVIDVLDNDSALPGFGTLDPATLAVVAPPSAGSAAVAARTITYTPAPGTTGTATFRYRVCTTSGACGEAGVTVTVSANRPPAGVADAYEIAENGSLTVPAPGVLGNDSDPDPGDALHVRLVRGVTNGRLVLNANGGFDYTPNPGTTGLDTFVYRVVDRLGEESADTEVTIAVVGPPGPPTASGDAYAVETGRVLDVAAPGVLGDDTAPDPRAVLRAELRADVTGGSLMLHANGAFTYAPMTGFTGTDSFTYVVRDDEGRVSQPATVSINVSGGGPPAPTLGSTAPADGSTVTTPVTLTATLTPPPGETVTAWRVDARRPGEAALMELSRGSGADVSAPFDPTRLANGAYVVAIRADASGGGTSVSEITLTVAGEFKPGRYETTFQDLSVDAGTIPVRLLRTYDSMDKSQGDFGIGWRLELASFRIDTNGPLGRGGWRAETCGSFPFLATCYTSTRPHVVTVTWPDGRVEQFDFTPNRGSILLPALTTSAYTARRDTGSTLRSIDDGLVLSGTDFLNGGLFGATGIFDPQRYVLTDREGTEYLIDRRLGLVGIRDRVGNTVDIGPEGIVSSSGPDVAFERDGHGRIERIVGPTGAVDYKYDAAGDLREVTDLNRRTTTLSYTGSHHLSQVSGATPLVRLDYHPDGRLASVTNGEGDIMTVTRSLSARQERIVGPDPRHTSVYSYDELGQVAQIDEVYDDRVVTQKFSYDEDGRMTEVLDPSGTSTVGYDAAGNVTRVEGLGAPLIEATYNGFGQPVEVKADGKVIRTYGYGPTGLRDSVRYPDGTEERFTYDNAGRLLTATDRADRTVTTTYDSRGFPATETRPAAGAGLTRAAAAVDTTIYQHDDAGRLREVTDAAGGRSTFEYDAVGNIVAYTDGNRHTWRFGYNAIGELETETDPFDRVRRYFYDAAGRLDRVEDRTDDWVEYERSPAGDVVAITASDGQAASFKYDEAGRLTDAVNETGSVALEWDDADTPTRETIRIAGLAGAYELSRAATPTGQPARVTDPFGTTTFGYEAGNVSRVEDTRAGTFTFGYDDQARPTTMTRPNGVDDSFAYELDRIASRTVRRGATLLEQHDYQYGATGLLASHTGPDGVDNYSYDAVGRLTGADHPSGSGVPDESYGYDHAGNRTSWTGHDAAAVRYDAANRLLEDGRRTYTYDAEGRLETATEIATGQVTRYTWNALDELVRIEASGEDAQLRYDPLGRLVSVTRNGERTFTIHDGYRPRLVLDGSGSLLSREVTYPDSDDVLAIEAAGQQGYPLGHVQATTTALTDAAGDVVARWRFDAFGMTGAAAATEQGAQWHGLQPGPGGLYTTLFRPYDPETGRFLSEDPLPTGNLYPYAGANPVGYRDPTGLNATVEYKTLTKKQKAQVDAICGVGAGIANAFAKAALTLTVDSLPGLIGTGLPHVSGIYAFADLADKAGRTYVGQAKDVFERLGRHMARGRLAPGSFVKFFPVPYAKSGPLKGLLRLAEQEIILECNGGRVSTIRALNKISNKINAARR